MARIPFLAGNWKLHLDPQASHDLAQALRQGLAGRTGVTVALFPTALSVASTLEAVEGSDIGVGVQDVEVASTGAFTGTNSASIARSMGCTYALCGHSERRQLYGDSDERIGQRVATSLAHGLLPILCIGETLEERRAGQVEAVVERQLERGLVHVSSDQLTSVTLAYEPVWAIGTGETASPEQAQAVHAHLRAWVRSRYGAALAEQIRIQYGGSVKPSNAKELLACPDIDGALIGGASLTADSFLGIIAAAR